MKNNSYFDDLFIFDMANNHQGSVEHGLEIIKSISEVCNRKGCRGAMKFQYRQLDTFIHPDFKNAKQPKHIPRFLDTRLSPDQFSVLVDEVKRNGLLAMCTPFDEESVDVIESHNIDIIKIASCSASDWPLLERVAKSKKPVVCSTAGLLIDDIDNVVSFFRHKNIRLAIMHCVAVYPTLIDDLQLNQIDLLKERYPFLPIGFSTHEEPSNMTAVKIAVSKGAKLLERHVGVVTDKISLNAYSSTPKQIGNWLDAAIETKKMCGANTRLHPKEEEIDSLYSLKRGVYAKTDICKGEKLDRNKVFFAMPLQKDQLHSGNFSEGYVVGRDYKVGKPLMQDEIDQRDLLKATYSLIHQAKGMLYQARIPIGRKFSVELSHHYGIEKFSEVGAIVIDCINRKYCKKLIIQVPNQFHPYHYHKLKEETFQVLWGELLLNLEGENHILKPGDQIVVGQGKKHSFTTKTGVIFEEISTTHHGNDSFYDDTKVYSDKSFRKTKLDNALFTFEQYDII